MVGGGDTAIEEALYLTRFASKVHLLHRRDEFRASQIMQARAESHPQIEIHRSVIVDEVLGDETVTGVRLREQRRPARRASCRSTASSSPSATGPTPRPSRAGWRRTRRATSSSSTRRTRGSRASSSPATSTTTATGRRSPRPATAAGRRSTPSAGSRSTASSRPSPRRPGERPRARGDAAPPRHRPERRRPASGPPSTTRSRGPSRARPAEGAAAPAVAVLDAGCGRSSALARYRPRIGRFVGVDIHAPGPGALPYLDEFATVDLCADPGCVRRRRPSTSSSSSFTVEHFADPPAAFANLAPVAAPGRIARPRDRQPPPSVRGRLPRPAGPAAAPPPAPRQGERRRRPPARRRLQRPAGASATALAAAGFTDVRVRRSATSPGPGDAACRPSPSGSSATC